MGKKKTATPTGTQVSRNKNEFTFSWKGKTNKKAWIKRYQNGKYMSSQTLDKGGNSTTYSVATTPAVGALKTVGFRVKGQEKKKKVSGESAYTKMTLKAPPAPKVSASRGAALNTTFTTETVGYTDTGAVWINKVQCQSVLWCGTDKAWEMKSPSSVTGWVTTHTENITKSGSHSHTYNDTDSGSWITNSECAIRYFRSRMGGPAGWSAWSYTYLTYKDPKPPSLTGANDWCTCSSNGRQGIDCSLRFDYKNTYGHRVSELKVQYAFAPARVLNNTAKTVQPINPSWQDAEIGGSNAIAPKGPSSSWQTSTISFNVDGINNITDGDKMMFVRVNADWENETMEGGYRVCIPKTGLSYSLHKPGAISIESAGTNRILVSSSISTECTPVYVAVNYTDGNSTNKIIDIITVNEGNIEKVVVLPPDHSNDYSISLYAFMGSYEEIYSETIEPGSVYKNYSVDPMIFQSQNKKWIKVISDTQTQGGTVIKAPENVVLSHLGDGNVLVTWDWTWTEAQTAEVAWSDYAEILDSTESPSSYSVPNYRSGKLIIRNLELGKTWYAWVRLIKDETASPWSDERHISLTSSPNIPRLSLTKEYITMDERFVANWVYVSVDGSPQASAKICTCDIVGEPGGESTITYNKTIAEIPNETITDPQIQYITLDPKELGWSSGNTYNLALQVTSETGLTSEGWSEPVSIIVIDPLDVSITQNSLNPNVTDYNPSTNYSVGDYVYKRINDDNHVNSELALLYKCVTVPTEPEAYDSATIYSNGDYVTKESIIYVCLVDMEEAEEWNEERWRAISSDEWFDIHFDIDEDTTTPILNLLPLTATISSSVQDSTATLIIERSKDYFIDRPDEGKYGGYAGETVVQKTANPGEQITINQEDLLTYLDDDAYYYLIGRTEDKYGQIAEVRYEFKVKWTHQALMPKATTEVDTENQIVKITINTPDLPDGTTIEDLTGDVCDIYRFTAEGATLIYSGATFGNTYVDPYPTIGEHGGHRIVYRTRNGDYITEEVEDGVTHSFFAWLDLDYEDGDVINSPSHWIDFDNDRAELMYNVDISNNWSKDFKETHYLGGTIQGDWNLGVGRSTSINVNVPTTDWDTVTALRNLAKYSGICRVRSRDGSNYCASIDVSEKIPYKMYYTPEANQTKLLEYSLSITGVDPIGLDGLTLADWTSMNDLSDVTGTT